ncbi:hypothetical protein ENBRE01_1171 [Enteropsectra breve]|nr:hypothetical protein ENBRE01_1171 [Enteropsectra breve]
MASLKTFLTKFPTFMIIKPGCPYCDDARDLLQSKDISFEEVVNSKDPELVREVREATRHPTFPMIYLKGSFIGGYTDLVNHFAKPKLGL